MGGRHSPHLFNFILKTKLGKAMSKVIIREEKNYRITALFHPLRDEVIIFLEEKIEDPFSELFEESNDVYNPVYNFALKFEDIQKLNEIIKKIKEG